MHLITWPCFALFSNGDVTLAVGDNNRFDLRIIGFVTGKCISVL
jgi:hypothetical protein